MESATLYRTLIESMRVSNINLNDLPYQMRFGEVYEVV